MGLVAGPMGIIAEETVITDTGSQTSGTEGFDIEGPGPDKGFNPGPLSHSAPSTDQFVFVESGNEGDVESETFAIEGPGPDKGWSWGGTITNPIPDEHADDPFDDVQSDGSETASDSDNFF